MINAILPSEQSSVKVEIPSGYNISQGVRSVIARDSNNFTGSAPILTDNFNLTVPENSTNITISKIGGKVYVNGQ